MKSGDILRHENMGTVVEVGSEVKNLRAIGASRADMAVCAERWWGRFRCIRSKDHDKKPCHGPRGTSALQGVLL
jgi:threonine dehydrogenase-like Zn-dependent dehydrogenase